MRSSLRAFALGIIFSTAIFTFMFYSHPVKKATAPDVQQIVKEYLAKNHLQTISIKEYKQLQSAKSKVAQLEKEKKQISTKKNETANQKNNDEYTYILTIDAGMPSGVIADKLKSANIIDNAEKFEEFLITKGYDTSIQMGQFQLNNHLSYDEIARIITNKK